MDKNDIYPQLVGEILQLSELICKAGGYCRRNGYEQLTKHIGDCMVIVHIQLLRPILQARSDLIPDEWKSWWDK